MNIKFQTERYFYSQAKDKYRNGIGANEFYIIKVTGKVADKNKMAYVGHGKLERVSTSAVSEALTTFSKGNVW